MNGAIMVSHIPNTPSADTACGATASPTQPTAAQVVTRLAQRVPDASPGAVYAADTDPNHIMGRPGGYLSKASFTDKRITAEKPANVKEGSVALGGSVEVFADSRAAHQRKNYIQALARRLTEVAEYDYVEGPVLVRVAKTLAVAQAGEYDKALREIAF